MIDASIAAMPSEYSRFQAQQSYTDLNQLNDIRLAGKDDKHLALKQVAQQFESMFMQMMLKSMRSANEVFAKDNPLNSFEMGFHRDMLDNQLSLSLSQGRGMGIADALYRQMSQHYLPDSASAKQSDITFDRQALVSTNPYEHAPREMHQRNKDSRILDQVKSPEDFIAAVTPYAKKAAAALGVDYKVLIAQSALETGWGEHSIRDRYGNHSFNLFNIKADSRWSGHHVSVPTLEYRDGLPVKEVANFRRYITIEDAFMDYQQFLQQPRYGKALAVASDATAYTRELQNAGYATDPFYAEKINRILKDHLL